MIHIRHRFASMRTWLQRHPKLGYSFVVVGLLIFAALAYAIVSILSQKFTPFPDIDVKPRPEHYYSPLTGVEVKSKAATTKPITAVVIENSPEARPQSGLKAGEVVYEAIAEGGITRFLVFYQTNTSSLIGPVRSLRHYHLDVAKPYQASLAHVGGSRAALKQVRAGNSWRDLEQMFNGNFYWRTSDRLAPHNVYTSSAKLAQLNKKKGYRTSKATGLSREDVKAKKPYNAKKVRINISSGSYNSVYTYSTKTGRYTRSQGGAVHKDREKGPITTKVIVALKVKEYAKMQDTWRQIITTTGNGKATIFQNGRATNVTWKRASKSHQFKFYTKKGDEVKLDRGTTWLSLVPRDKGSVSWR